MGKRKNRQKSGPVGPKPLPILKLFQDLLEEVFVIFRAVFGPPWGREGAQNVAQEHSSLGTKYRPNPANGDPIGGRFSFLHLDGKGFSANCLGVFSFP